MRATAALALLLFRHWARASLPNRLRRDKGRRASAGLFRFAYFAMMSAWGFAVGHLVALLPEPEQRTRGAAWILVGLIGLAVMWSALTRGPTLRGEPSPLETTFLDTLPLREESRLAVGLLERLFVYALGGSALVGVMPSSLSFLGRSRAVFAAVLISTAGICLGEALMRLARILVPAMTIARARSYLLVLGQVFFLMCVVQAPSLAKSPRLGVVVAGWPSTLARALETADPLRFLFVIVLPSLGVLAVSLLALFIAERVGYDKVELVPTDKLRRSKLDMLVVDRIDEVLRNREPGGRWSTLVMSGYTMVVTAFILMFAWHARAAAAEQGSTMIRGACGLAAFGAFVVVTARASRMAARDITARPMLAPLPIEPRALLSGKIVRLRRDALMIAAPVVGLLAAPWSVGLHIETAWRTGTILIAVVLAANAGAAISFLTVGAGSKKGPGGSFVVESILVLVPLIGVASASYAWSAIVPLAALALVSREAKKSALGCVRWLDDADDFERETPIWRALLVLGAFQSAQVLTGRLVGLSELDDGTKVAIAYAVSSIVLVTLTFHARRDAPRMRLWPEQKPWLLAGAITGLTSGVLALGYLVLIKKLGVELPETPSTNVSRVAVALTAIGLAPVAEEIFFRGWLLSCIDDSVADSRHPQWRGWLTPLASAFAFAAVHPAISFVPVFVLGLIASLLFRRTHALGPSILAHFCHNAVALLFAS